MYDVCMSYIYVCLVGRRLIAIFVLVINLEPTHLWQYVGSESGVLLMQEAESGYADENSRGEGVLSEGFMTSLVQFISSSNPLMSC